MACGLLVCTFLTAGILALVKMDTTELAAESEQYKEAKKIDGELNKTLLMMKTAKEFPSLNLLNASLKNVPEDISIKSININENKSKIIGVAGNVDTINKYCQSIEYPGYVATLSGIKKDSSGSNIFTIEIEKAPDKKPPRKVGEKNV